MSSQYVSPSFPVPAVKRIRWTAAALAILLFCLGVTAGILAERYYHATTATVKTAEDWREGYVREMRSKLKLTDQQVAQLNVILDETKARFKAVRDSIRPALLQIKNEQIAQVKSILTPAQVPGYEKLVAEREKLHREQEERDQRREKQAEARRKSGRP